jgi:hypothetical protein
MGRLKLKSYSLGGVCISVGVLCCLPWAVASMASSPQLGGVLEHLFWASCSELISYRSEVYK